MHESQKSICLTRERANDLAMLSKIFFPPGKIGFSFSPLFFGKIGQNPPGSLKLDPASQDFQYEPNPSEFDRFRQTFSFFENLQKKCQKKWPKNESIFNFSPTPQPPSPSPQTPKDAPDHAGVVRQSFIPIGQNGTPVMPIWNFRKSEKKIFESTAQLKRCTTNSFKIGWNLIP